MFSKVYTQDRKWYNFHNYDVLKKYANRGL